MKKDEQIIASGANMTSASLSMTPVKQGLYDPKNEKDACGVGFVANMKGEKTHSIVKDGLQILENLEHRGAVGADPLMGDGAGLLVQIPHEFFAEVCEFDLPEAGEYGVAQVFMPTESDLLEQTEAIFIEGIEAEGLTLLGVRTLEVDNSGLSQDPAIMATEPVHKQFFVTSKDAAKDNDAFERKLYQTRKVISNKIFTNTNARESG